MPEPGSGDQPPGRRTGPTFRDVEALTELVVKAGTRAARSTDAEWPMDMSITQERARSRKRFDGAPVEIERKDLEMAFEEIVEDAARRALPNHDEGLKIIGSHQECKGASLEVRSNCAARARGCASGKHWRQRYRPEAIELIAEELYRLIYYSDSPSAPQEEVPTHIS